MKRGELQGCSEDRALKTGSNSVEANVGYERSKARVAKSGPILLSIGTTERDQSPSGSMQKENTCLSIRY